MMAEKDIWIRTTRTTRGVVSTRVPWVTANRRPPRSGIRAHSSTGLEGGGTGVHALPLYKIAHVDVSSLV